MDVKQSMLRLAAATAVTVFMAVGAVGPVHAADGKSDDKSASSQGAQKKADATSDTSDPATTDSDHSEGNASTTGDYNEPQPESTADQNDGGANAGTCPEGQYCSTRDGSASQNGEGDGKATGRPCMGCVGKADNKNPKGQVGEDPSKNKGYECDDNKGIGKGNPAHTGCTEGSTPSEGQPATVCPEGSTMNDAGECVVPPKDVTCPEGSTMNDAGECVLPTKQETCPQGATMNDAGECVLPAEEVTCPKDATMNSEGECIVPAVPAQTGPGQVAPQSGNQVLGVQAERSPSAGVAGSTANRAAALVAPVAGILPSTGAGQYGLVIVGGIVLLVAGGVLLARRRPRANR